ncbi:transposase [Halomarina litorea]|uniref:transposase n=1 Tax=Halomarina litorea TaxID=2961595 RepID=UPI0020C58CA1|nr:transposase [Halomarina sp. BCD28]
MRHGESNPPHESHPAATDETRVREETEVWAYEVDDHSFDICYDLYVSVSHEGAPFSVSLWYDHPVEGASTLDDLIGELVFNDALPDNRAQWHHNTGPLEPILRAHNLRIARGWRERRLAEFLETNPEVAVQYGFVEQADDGTLQPNPMKQSRLWELWNESLPEATKAVCRAVLSEVVAIARDHSIPAPDVVFRPEKTTASRRKPKKHVTVDTTKKIWRHGKPFITDGFYLKRASNAEIPENAFFEQAAFMGPREDMCATGGSVSFYAETSRKRTSGGSNYRHQLSKLAPADVREMLFRTNQPLVKRAQRNSELVRGVFAAIDITKGNKWVGRLTRDEDNNIAEEWILGSETDEVHFNWASIQIIGLDIPLVLDAVPVHRGMKRADIVDTLLDRACELVNIELVLMDRGFDSAGVKDACDTHRVYYLNAARKFSSENATCDRLNRAGKLVHVEDDGVVAGRSRKKLFVPAVRTDDDNEESEPEDDTSDETRASDRQDVRGEMVEHLVEEGLAEAESFETEERAPGFEGVLDEMRVDEQAKDEEDHEQSYALFETNHPDITTDDDASDETVRIHMVERLVRQYRHRWGIENGYKKLKKFLVRTTSKNHEYRFFNFVFACVLYNIWRLVDLLVKLAIEGENASYEPYIDADLFLTVASDYFGLDPPD